MTASIRPCPANNEDIWVPDFDVNGIDSQLHLLNRKRWGFIDSTGKFVIPAQYDMVKAFKHGDATVADGNRYFEIDRLGKCVSPIKTRVDVINESNQLRWAHQAIDLAADKLNKFTGDVWDAAGTTLIANAKEFEISPFSEGLAACKVPEKLLPKFKLSRATDLSGKAAAAPSTDELKTNPIGYIDGQGRMIIAPQFSHAAEFHDGIAVVEHFGSTDTTAGYINKKGELIGGRYFKYAWPFENGFGLVEKGNLPGEDEEDGFLSRDGKQIMGHWTQVYPFASGDRAPVHAKNGKWGFIDRQAHIVVAPQFELVDCNVSPNGLTYAKTEKGYGYLGFSGKFVIEPQFVDADSFSEGLAAVAINLPEQETLRLLARIQKWRCGFIDRNGSEVIPPRFFGAGHFSEGLAAVQDGLKWGFINERGDIVIAPQFDAARPFSHGMAAVLKNGYWGFVDKSGHYKIQPRFPAYSETSGSQREFQPPWNFSEGVTLAGEPDFLYRFIDMNGHESFRMPVSMTTSIEPDAKPFAQGLAVMANKDIAGTYGYIDHTGAFQIKPKGASALSFSEGLAAVSIIPDASAPTEISDLEHYCVPKWRSNLPPPKVGFVNKSGEFVVRPQFDETSSFKEGLAAVASGKYVNESRGEPGTIRISKTPPGMQFKAKWGFIDKTGKSVIEPQFDAAQDFSQGLAAIQIGEKWGYVDHTGRVVVQPIYDSAKSFSDDLAVVKLDGKYGCINKDGKLVIPAKYLLCGSFSNGRALIVSSSEPRTTVNTSQGCRSGPIETEDDMQNFFIEHGQAPDRFSWEGHEH